MGFWTFVLMAFIGGIFGYFSKSYFSGFVLFIFLCIVKMLLNWIRDEII